MDSGILMIQDSILVCSPDPRILHTAIALTSKKREICQDWGYKEGPIKIERGTIIHAIVVKENEAGCWLMDVFYTGRHGMALIACMDQRGQVVDVGCNGLYEILWKRAQGTLLVSG
jgi:hypothetical protein